MTRVIREIDQLNEIFREVLDDEDLVVSEETTAADVEDWDSMAQVQLVVEIEKRFNIRFNAGDVSAMKSVGDMVDYVRERTSQS